jgi:aldose 1-epimerase
MMAHDPLIISAGNNRMEILPSLGGTVQLLSLAPSPESSSVSLLKGDRPDELPVNPWFRGRILFPFCDRIPGGTYVFQDVLYQLPPNQEDGSAIHGLVYDRPGKVTASTTTGDSQAVSLSWITGEDPGYPFSLELTVSYKVSTMPKGTGRGELIFSVRNCDTKDAPVGFGWHPYFRLPDCGMEDLRISIPCRSYVEVEENLVPTGRILPVEKCPGGLYNFRNSKIIASGEYDTAFPLDSGALSASATISSSTLKLTMTAGGAFSYFQLFTPPDRTAVALEPISNVTDAFNRKDFGMRVLEPGKRIGGKVTLEIASL